MLHFFIQTWKQYIIVRLQIKYLSIGGLHLDENSKFRQNFDETGDFGWTKNDTLDNIFLVSRLI